MTREPLTATVRQPRQCIAGDSDSVIVEERGAGVLEMARRVLPRVGN